jgi:5-methylthioadenosine/S-adenosylhomocysteine deaminase
LQPYLSVPDDLLLIRGGRILTAAYKLEVLDIATEGGTIARVGRDLLPRDGVRELDARGDIIIPGLINGHTHAPNNLAKGELDNVTLEYARSSRVVGGSGRTPEDDYIAAAIGAIEMLRTGSTACYDLFAPSEPTPDAIDAVAQAYGDVGLRATLAPLVSDDSFISSIPGLEALLPPAMRSALVHMTADASALVALTGYGIRRWHESSGGRIRFATAPAIPGECTVELLQGCMRLVREHGVGMHTHLAETEVQARAARRRWAMSIVRYLDSLDCLGPHFVGAHSVWIEPEDIAVLAERGAMVAHNPASNLKLGNGVAPVREMLDAGVVVGLGTDGSATSDNQDMFGAMRLAALVGKPRFPYRPERWIGSHDALSMATLGSSALLGLGDHGGAIAPGRVADLCILKGRSVFLRPLNEPVNALVYAETGADVKSVIIGGRIILHNGHVTTVDEEALFARAIESAHRLRERGAGARELTDKLWPFVRRACENLLARDHDGRV